MSSDKRDSIAVQPAPAPRLPPRWFIRCFWVLHRAAYSLSGGRIGLRSATADRWGMLRLRTIGRHTGEERKAIVGYLEDGSDLILLATNGMGSSAPAWRLNLEAQPDASVDLPGGSRAVRARVAEGSERSRLWAMWVRQGEELDAHAAAIPREVPVVVLEPRLEKG
jgi:deazaflavin-dependent oxidoreductase (nitroreductase family)